MTPFIPLHKFLDYRRMLFITISSPASSRRRVVGCIGVSLQICCDLLPDGFGYFDADGFDPAFVLGEGAAVLGCIDKNQEIGPDAHLRISSAINEGKINPSLFFVIALYEANHHHRLENEQLPQPESRCSVSYFRWLHDI